MAPGFSIQFPAGKPVNTMLPVATKQVGCVTVPATGADGIAGCGLITTLADATEIHPDALVTVKLYVPTAKPATVLLAPLPDMAPGLIVQVPAGKPLRSTLPVEEAQVGWVIVLTTGADGVAGCTLIIIFAENDEVHPTALVTLYE